MSYYGGPNRGYPPPAGYPGYPGYPSNIPFPAGPRVRFDAIGEAWNLMTRAIGTWIAAMLIIVGLGVVAYALMVGIMAATIGLSTRPGPPPPMTQHQLTIIVGGSGALALGAWAASSYLIGGLISMALKQVRGGQITIADMFTPLDILPTEMLASLLVGLATMAGAVLCVFPAYIVQGLLMLTVPLVVDRRIGAAEALGMSWNALKREWLMATIFLFVLNFLAAIGMWACGIGMLFTMPLLFLGQAIVYRDFFDTGMTMAAPPFAYPGPPIEFGTVHPTDFPPRA